MSDTEVYEFGFKWGPAWVHRIMRIAGKGRLLSVKTDHTNVEVWISDKGRRIRVWRDGEELT